MLHNAPEWESGSLVGKGRPRVDTEIFHEEEYRETLREMYREIRTQYPPEVYGHAAVWDKQMVSAAHLMRLQSAARRQRAVSVTDYRREMLSKNVTKLIESGPDPLLRAAFLALREGTRRAVKSRVAARPTALHRRVAFEEVNTKQFHYKFRPKHEKRYIPELFPMGPDGTPDAGASPVDDPQQM